MALLPVLSLLACDPEPGPAPDARVRDYTEISTNSPIFDGEGDTLPTDVPVPVIRRAISRDSILPPHYNPPLYPKKTVPFYSNEIELKEKRRIRVIELAETYKPEITRKKVLAKKLEVRFPEPVASGLPDLDITATYDIQFLGEEQGLHGNQFTDIVSGPKGDLWLGGSLGNSMVRYTGNAFSYLTQEEGLPMIFALYHFHGIIWMGGVHWNFITYDGNSFRSFAHHSFTQSIVGAMQPDPAGDIWSRFTTDGERSLFKFSLSQNGDTLNLETCHLENISPSTLGAVQTDGEGNVWFVSGRRLGKFDGENVSFYKLGEEDGLALGAFEKDSSGTFWISTSHGLVQFDGEAAWLYSDEKGYAQRGRIATVDRKDRIWLVLDSQLIQFDGERFRKFGLGEGLDEDGIFDVYEDPSGILWVSGSKGLWRLRLEGSFRRFGQAQGMAGEAAWAMMQDSLGNVWVSHGALHHPENGLSVIFGDSVRQYETSEIRVLHPYSKGFAVAGVGEWDLGDPPPPDGGLAGQGGYVFFDYDLETGRINSRSITHDRGLPAWMALTSMEDRSGDIWFGCLNGNVRFQPDQSEWLGKISYYHLEPVEGWNHSANAIQEDRNGNKWFGFWDGGLVKLEGNQYIRYSKQEGLPSNSPWALHFDERGRLWIGTLYGLSVFDGSGFSNYSRKDDLFKTKNNYKSLKEDKEGRIWAATGEGIVLFAPVSPGTDTLQGEFFSGYRVYTFGKGDGLHSETFDNWGSVLLDDQDRIWWGSSRGLTRLNLNEFEVPEKAPENLQLSQVSVLGEYVDFRRLARKDYQDALPFGKELAGAFDSVARFENYPLGLRLPYWLNHLTFHFTATDWQSPHQIKYSYRIKGIDPDWSQVSVNPFADYRNLPHGKHVLEVRAMGIAQQWSETYSYPFTVYPPWWQSWPALLIYFLTGLGLIYGYVRRRTALLRRKQKILEKEVQSRTAEVVAEKQRSDELLLNILPASIAEELKQRGAAKAQHYDRVTVLFTDFQQFTQHAERLPAEELVEEIDLCFKAFDRILEKYNVEKIKTIGDAYMAAAGLPTPNQRNPEDAVKAALAIRDFMLHYKAEREAEGREPFQIRIGVHTGPVVAGIVGIKKYSYDIWGDTVNLAARMETSGEVGKVNISHSTYECLKENSGLAFEPRGKVEAKNKGEVEMYFVERNA